MKQLTLDIGLASGPRFSNFIAGPNEAVARHLQLWLGERGGAGPLSPVPNYLWGPPGSGKTHLLRAVRDRLREMGVNPTHAVGWLDAGVQEPVPFCDGWVLIVLDDVQLYTAEQQHMAFNWFVNAQTQGCAVLAAGQFPPADLKLREDLRTRLGWGHVFALQALDESARRGVLRKAADERGLFLGDEVLDFMLNRFSRDLGSLMELLTLLDGYSLQTQRPITIPLIKSMLDNT